MSLEQQISKGIMEAMKAKDTVRLSALRNAKKYIIEAKTAGPEIAELPDADVLKIISKLAKQGTDSAAIFSEQNRPDLASEELAQVAVFQEFLPRQLTPEELTAEVKALIAEVGATSMKEMGKVMGVASKRLAGRADGKDYEFAMQDVAQDKCRACTVPNAVIHDHFAGSPTNIPDGAQPAMPAIMTFLDGLSLEDRMGFWRGHIDRCIRCYACRNACPMCVCRDNCVADSREPHWLTQEDSPTQKMFFQLIHAMHLAGRCTGCGECNRACPMGIPVGALKLQMGRVVKKLFEYAPGMDVDAVPPLLGFQLEEKNIHEHHIEGA